MKLVDLLFARVKKEGEALIQRATEELTQQVIGIAKDKAKQYLKVDLSQRVEPTLDPKSDWPYPVGEDDPEPAGFDYSRTHEFILEQGGWEWVYVFTYPSFLELAELKSEPPLMKIGMTTGHYSRRVKEQTQGQSGIAEAPITVLAIRCPNGSALEKELHGRLRQSRAYAQAGTEWFRVLPEQVLQTLHGRLRPHD